MARVARAAGPSTPTTTCLVRMAGGRPKHALQDSAEAVRSPHARAAHAHAHAPAGASARALMLSSCAVRRPMPADADASLVPKASQRFLESVSSHLGEIMDAYVKQLPQLSEQAAATSMLPSPPLFSSWLQA